MLLWTEQVVKVVDPYMKFAEFLDGYFATVLDNQRSGQYLFNFLYHSRPEIADAIRDTECDPFYDDTRIPLAINRILELWYA